MQCRIRDVGVAGSNPVTPTTDFLMFFSSKACWVRAPRLAGCEFGCEFSTLFVPALPYLDLPTKPLDASSLARIAPFACPPRRLSVHFDAGRFNLKSRDGCFVPVLDR
jgi:hypothetical protein